MEKIDVFAHVLLPNFYKRMLMLDDKLPDKMPFIQNPVLTDVEMRRKQKPVGVRQVISYVNTNPEDYMAGKMAALLVEKANEELLETVTANPDLFAGAVAMLALNNIDKSIEILENFVAANQQVLGIQLFTRHLGQSVADDTFKPIFAKCAELDIPIWLHPVFDERKPDNNIIFSWEYELTQAMLQIVQAKYFQEFPDLKIIVHHAGAMVPYFAGRIERILPADLAQNFKKFYVDTAILGNSKALELCLDYFGVDHVFFGTDAPLGILPAGASKEIIQAINDMAVPQADKDLIFSGNFDRLLRKDK
ncbi:amidohydrolase family protein [Streptococcus caballi]|uniref:amidohydrolase family protein n=1 Tax=Streptococcus caballi TaxID=439220 RepID=UPI00035CF7B8|nr:amidohydrolase family protein [Streptococcus caballi]